MSNKIANPEMKVMAPLGSQAKLEIVALVEKSRRVFRRPNSNANGWDFEGAESQVRVRWDTYPTGVTLSDSARG